MDKGNKEMFIMIPDEIWKKGIEDRSYLACYLYVLFNKNSMNYLEMTKKSLFNFLGVIKPDAKKKVEKSLQDVLNDIVLDNEKINTDDCSLNDTMYIFIDKDKIKTSKAFAKIYLDDYAKLMRNKVGYTKLLDEILFLCYYRSKMIKRRSDVTVEIAPPILYGFNLMMGADLGMGKLAINSTLNALCDAKIIKTYSGKVRKTSNGLYIHDKKIIYDYVNRDEIYSNDEILEAAIKYVNKVK